MSTCTARRRFALTAFACLTLFACGGDPSSPAAPPVEEDIAARLDDISREQSRRGDYVGSREVAWAAMALRSGVRPSQLTVREDGAARVYLAFAQGLSFPMVTALTTPDPRFLVAWRRSRDSTYLLTVSSIADAASVTAPWSAGGFASPVVPAQVSYLTGGESPTLWVGISGNVAFTRRTLGDKCPVPSIDPAHRPRGVECRLATYAVAFDVTAQMQRFRAAGAASDGDPGSFTVRLAASEQVVNGSRLEFSCFLPDREC